MADRRTARAEPDFPFLGNFSRVAPFSLVGPGVFADDPPKDTLGRSALKGHLTRLVRVDSVAELRIGERRWRGAHLLVRREEGNGLPGRGESNARRGVLQGD